MMEPETYQSDHRKPKKLPVFEEIALPLISYAMPSVTVDDGYNGRNMMVILMNRKWFISYHILKATQTGKLED